MSRERNAYLEAVLSALVEKIGTAQCKMTKSEAGNANAIPPQYRQLLQFLQPELAIPAAVYFTFTLPKAELMQILTQDKAQLKGIIQEAMHLSEPEVAAEDDAMFSALAQMAVFLHGGLNDFLNEKGWLYTSGAMSGTSWSEKADVVTLNFEIVTKYARDFMSFRRSEEAATQGAAAAACK